jgi:hypothetical protein
MLVDECRLRAQSLRWIGRRTDQQERRRLAMRTSIVGRELKIDVTCSLPTRATSNAAPSRRGLVGCSCRNCRLRRSRRRIRLAARSLDHRPIAMDCP